MGKNGKVITVEAGQLAEVQLARLLRFLSMAIGAQEQVSERLKEVAAQLAALNEPGRAKVEGARAAAFNLAFLLKVLPPKIESYLYPAPGAPLTQNDGKIPAGWKIARCIVVYEAPDDAPIADWND